jgi:hypothetical protein
VLGKAKLRQSRREPGALVHPGGKNHHGALVVDHLQLQSLFLDGFQDGRIVWLDGGDNHLADGEGYAFFAQRIEKRGWRRLREGFCLTARRSVKDRAVVRHDAVKNGVFREHLKEIVELAARYEDRPASGILQALEGVECAGRDDAFVRQRAIVVTSQGEIAHC